MASKDNQKVRPQFLTSGVWPLKNGFLFAGLPMPPTSNQSYAPRSSGTGRNTGFIGSKQLNASKQDFETWALFHSSKIRESYRYFTKVLRTKEYVLHVDRLFFFPNKSVMTKDKKPKKIDVTNRIKVFDDAMAKMIGIDDKWFWSGTEKKVFGDSVYHGFVIAAITTIRIPDPQNLERQIDEIWVKN